MITHVITFQKSQIHYIHIFCFFATVFEVIHTYFICLYVFRCSDRSAADGHSDSQARC